MIEQDIEILFNKEVAAGTFLMGLRSSEIVAQGRPGQFVMIRVSRGMDPLLRRPFSLCGIQGEDVFFLLYRVVGRGTAILSKAREGEQMPVVGPLGRGFELPKKGHKSVLVAGGIGIAPLIFLAQSIGPADVTFMAGYRSANEIVPMEQVGFTAMEILISTDDGTAGHHGFVTDLLEPRLAGHGADISTVFTCGPRPMLKRVVEITDARGVPCQASLETAMACGLGACQGCAVNTSSQEFQPYYHVCQDGPVFDVSKLDWEVM